MRLYCIRVALHKLIAVANKLQNTELLLLRLLQFLLYKLDKGTSRYCGALNYIARLYISERKYP